MIEGRSTEQLRILRDVHDGIGPILTGMAFGLRAVRNLLGRDTDSAERLLAQLEEELYDAIAELRRLTDGIHPSVLDRFGLVEAIHLHASALASRVETAGGHLEIEVRALGDLSALTPAVRLAAYRIICEALTNMVRHSGARSCVVWLRVDGDLHLEIVDDGVGLPGGELPPSSGVGLRSMRERALELGGGWTIEPGMLGGTRVVATFPVRDE
jgi:signal transduction histidine kinase